MKHPYIIVAPSYDHKSAGIRALYNLKNYLFYRGYEVEITQRGTAPNNAIVIYPEIVIGNPLNAKTVVRYLLCFPGAIGGDGKFADTDLLFTYSSVYSPGSPVLTIPVIGDFFRNEGRPRKGNCFWVGKGKNIPRIPETDGLIEVTYDWPKTRKGLATFLNTIDTFYSYDAFSALNAEAELCGCKVVIIPGATNTVSYKDQIADFESQLDFFISSTQQEADKRCACVARNKPPARMKISNFHFAIMVPLSFPFVPASFFHSFVMMDRPDYTYIHADNGNIDDLRNNLINTALEKGCTHGVMMDVDQVYHPQTIPQLLSHKLPMVGALVHRRYVPFDSLMLKIVGIDEHTNGYASIDDWEDGSLVNVDATGGGCVMFDLQLFRDLDKIAQKEIDEFNALKPSAGELSLMSASTRQYILGLQQHYTPPNRPGVYFKGRLNPDGSVVGEDMAFCQRVKAAGYDIFVDTSVPAGHLASLIINTATNRLYRACKNTQAAELALAIDKPGDIN